jgi:hypothetical protein
MAVSCQNLPLGALGNRSSPSMLVGELFKKFGLFLNTPCIKFRWFGIRFGGGLASVGVTTKQNLFLPSAV